jgi:hypothetical protein
MDIRYQGDYKSTPLPYTVVPIGTRFLVEPSLACHYISLHIPCSGDVKAGLIHECDRGVQYLSSAFVTRLHNIDAHVNMSVVDNPFDKRP